MSMSTLYSKVDILNNFKKCSFYDDSNILNPYFNKCVKEMEVIKGVLGNKVDEVIDNYQEPTENETDNNGFISWEVD